MSVDKTIELQEKYVMSTYSPLLLLTKGAGSYVWDADDKKYLDFVVGISVCNLGHCHPDVTKAIHQQAERLVHVSNIYFNEKQPLLADKLIGHGFDGVVFFGNSGAEANEGMIKFARKWGMEQGRNEIIVMDGSFHGRTLTTLAATGQKKYRKGFDPVMPGFVHVPFNDISAVEEKISGKTAAVMLEPIQGEGGIIPAEVSYLKELRTLCDRHGILLLFDEVQCGMGRTGSFYAYQQYDVIPDALTLAKALGNGYPIGALIVKRNWENVLSSGSHASTFGGSPLACAAACAVIDVIDRDGILENVKVMGTHLKKSLHELKKKHKTIEKVRGSGLMVGIVFDPPEKAKALIPVLSGNGLLAITAGENVLRLLPPLTVSSSEIDQAVSILDKSLSEIEI